MHFQVQMQDNDTNNIFIVKHTTNKVNVTFLAVIKKEVRWARCIQNVGCNKILENGKKNMFREKKTMHKIVTA